jgi:hypothetical protein
MEVLQRPLNFLPSRVGSDKSDRPINSHAADTSGIFLDEFELSPTTANGDTVAPQADIMTKILFNVRDRNMTLSAAKFH